MTFDNLITGINDTTFQNVFTPIGQGIQNAVNGMMKTPNTGKIEDLTKEQQEGIVSGVIESMPSPQEKGEALQQIQAEKENESALNNALKWAEEQQKKEWEREDEIRKEVQAREDNALQRWTEDARKAGINPNLFSGQGAASGGGITAATGLNMSQYETTANRLLTEWEKMVDQEFERNENKKDRFNNIMKNIIGLASLGAFSKIGKK